MSNPGPGPTAPSQVVWQRNIDHAGIARRWSLLLKFYAIPSAVILLIGLVLGGIGPFLGLLILLGLFGLLLLGLVFFKNMNAKQNPTITREGDELVLGQWRVPLSRVESWSTTELEEDWAVTDQFLFGNPSAGNAITARVTFRLRPDGSGKPGIVNFLWAMMPPQELARVRDAIAPHVPAPLTHAEGS